MNVMQIKVTNLLMVSTANFAIAFHNNNFFDPLTKSQKKNETYKYVNSHRLCFTGGYIAVRKLDKAINQSLEEFC